MKTEQGAYWCSRCKRFVGRRLDEGRCPVCEGAEVEWGLAVAADDGAMTRHWSDDEARAVYLQELACAPRRGATPVVDLEALEARQAYVERQQFMRDRTIPRAQALRRPR
jgi:hypothetical protein